MEFGPVFFKWISILYDHPVVALRINGQVSGAFPVSRGTRQGCPLSLGLFVLLMEPLAIALRSSPHIQGIQIGSLTETTALYADDIVLVLGDTGPSLQAALSTLDSFSVVFALKLNWSKSKILPLRSHPALGDGLDDPSPVGLSG